jgi:aryl-phospho-beta-D-glucosidase BglC (GH1 family)
MQPKLNSPLKSAELARLKSCFDAAAAEGMRVIPNVHNYGYYAFSTWDYRSIGSTSVPISAFKDLWVRLAEAWNGHPAIAGYDIMNEPHNLPGGVSTWERTSQAAVEGIRGRDANTRVWVAGYNTRPGYKNGLFCLVANHPRAWIVGANVDYTTHCYYGPGAAYKLTYEEAVAYWASQGY